MLKVKVLQKKRKIPKKKSKPEKGIADVEYIEIKMDGRKHGRGNKAYPLVAPTDPSKGDAVIGIALEDTKVGDLLSIVTSGNGTIGMKTPNPPPEVKSNATVDKKYLKMTVPNSLILEILQEISNETNMGPVESFGYDSKEEEWSVVVKRLKRSSESFPIILRLADKESIGPTDSFRRTRKIKRNINERLGRTEVPKNK